MTGEGTGDGRIYRLLKIYRRYDRLWGYTEEAGSCLNLETSTSGTNHHRRVLRKNQIDLLLQKLAPKLEQMKLELAKALNTTYNAYEVLLILEHFDTLMKDADVQLKK
jgi:hypothetical protein